MDSRIENCKTLAQLGELETELGFDMIFLEYQQIFERRMEFIQRVLEWGREHRAMGLIESIGDSWTPTERQRFLDMWKDDEPLRSITFGSGTVLENMMGTWTDEQRARFEHDWQDDEPLLQVGRGQKRSFDEVNDGAGTSEQVSDNFFTVSNVKQVKVKKFSTTGMDYTVQFMDTFAHLELSQYHDRLHEIFESLLNTVTQDIPERDQVRFVLQSPQLETPISLSFLPRERLTTERVLAEIERVIQSNHEFRLNDSVNVNLIHVECPTAEPAQNAVKLIWKNI
jgi:hypothetical protein